MQFSNNPQSVYSGMISGQRNMILLSSVAIVMHGFVSKFNLPSIFTYLTILMMVMAAVIGINAAFDFEYYLDNVGEIPRYYNIVQWRRWKYISYIYSAFLVVLAIYVLVIEVSNK